MGWIAGVRVGVVAIQSCSRPEPLHTIEVDLLVKVWIPRGAWLPENGSNKSHSRGASAAFCNAPKKAGKCFEDNPKKSPDADTAIINGDHR